jgi:hypothetical protein
MLRWLGRERDAKYEEVCVAGRKETGNRVLADFEAA